MVMFVYRDDYYLKMQEPKDANFTDGEKLQDAISNWQARMEKAHNKADLIIAKQRHGPTGTIPLFFEAEFTRFGDLDHVHSDDGY
jgi:replicative DNA helicase